MVLTGRWAVVWGDAGEEEALLERWDVISVPAGVMRGFRNAGDEDAYLLAVVGGTDAGRITWAPEVVEEASRFGARLDERGFLAPSRSS